MGIAISLIFATALILPGILFNYYLRKGTWKSPVILRSFQNELAIGVLYSIAIHLFLLGLIDYFCSIRYEILFQVFFESFSELSDSEMKEVYTNVYNILGYFLLSYIIAILAGILLFILIRKTRTDLVFQDFKFSNEWHYYFSGEARVFAMEKPTYRDVKSFLKQPIDGVYLSFTLSKNSEEYLYWGLLYEYYFDKKGQLDKLILTEVSRRRLSDDKSIAENVNRDDMEPIKDGDSRFYFIRGQYLVVNYSEIKDLNIEYLVLEEE